MDNVTLVTEDGVGVEVDRASAGMLGILQPLLAFPGTASFPLPMVKSPVLAKVLEYVAHHRDDPRPQQAPSAAPHGPHSELSSEDDAHSAHGESGSESDSLASDDEQLFAEYVAATTPWDQRFLDGMELAALVEVTKAANYLNVPGLLDLCCRTIARQMTGLRAAELRAKFNLPHDFTPEEEARIASEFSWVDD
jgi:S-phase kinase-associated protein 1